MRSAVIRAAYQSIVSACLLLTLGTMRLAAAPSRSPGDTCATMPPPTDWALFRVYASIRAPLRKDSLPSAYLDLVLDGLRHGFLLPAPLALSVYAPSLIAGNGVMAPVALGEVVFTLDASGKVSDIHLTQGSLSPSLDRSLYDSPRRADSLQAFPPQFGVEHQEKIRFFVTLSSLGPGSGRSLVFFEGRMPAWRPGSQALVDPRQDMQPIFPVTARSAGVSDSVSIEFVVDEHGVPVPTTMRVLDAQYLDYARLVVDAALKSRYTPATAAGCPVKGLIRRTWQMTMTRRYE